VKSREEYEKSIYAKRDALIMKKKQRIATATSLLCVVICFVAAAIFLPKNLNKAAFDTTTSTTIPSTTAPTTVEDLAGLGGEAGLFDESGEVEAEETQSAVKVEHYTCLTTMIDNYTKPATTVKATTKKQNQFGYTPEGSDEKGAGTVTQTEIGITEIALETEIYWEDGSRPNKPSTTVKPIFNDHAEEKAIDAAFGYLTDEQKAKVDMDAHIDVSVTRNADGTEYFTVHLDTADGAYLVSVDSKTFEFVNFRELKKTTGTMVSQGYNPNGTTAKPPVLPATTAASEYIPN
jgi:hypothetical protein